MRFPRFLRRASAPFMSSRVTEGSAEDFIRDRGGFQGRRVGSKDDDVDMTPEQRAIARQLSMKRYQDSGLYGAVVDRFMEHVIGDGVKLEFADSAVEDWINDQFDRPENRFFQTIASRLTRLAVEGEQVLCISTPARGVMLSDGRHANTGDFFLGRLDLAGIQGVEVSPFNHDAIMAIRYGGQFGGQGVTLPIARPDVAPVPFDEAGSPVIVGEDKTLALPPGARLCGIQFQRAKTIGRRSGPLFSRIIDRAGAMEELFQNLLQKVEYLNRFWVWVKNEALSGNDTDSDKAFAKKMHEFFAKAEPGEALVTGKNVTIESVVPDLKIMDHKALYDMGLDMTLGAYAVPRMWYSSGGDTNRATAAEQGSPIHRAVGSWQGNVAQLSIEDMILFLLYLGERAGVTGVQSDSEFQVIMADVATRDSLRDADECMRVLLMLNEALDRGVIDEQEHQAIGRACLGGKGYGQHMNDAAPEIMATSDVVDAIDNAVPAQTEDAATDSTPAGAGLAAVGAGAQQAPSGTGLAPSGKASDAVWTGVQIKELKETILSVARGELDKETAVKVLVTAFPLTEAEARALLSTTDEGELESALPKSDVAA